MQIQKIKKNIEIIRSKLQQFNIDVEMEDVNIGPSFIQYTLRPSDGVKVSKIKSLKDDLALALASKSIRIEAPIPGQSLIGIEIPNENREIVRMDHILNEKYISYKESLMSDAICVIGKDSKGDVVYGNIQEMPHLLVAGATGSGKSMFINSLLLSLLYKRTPEDIQMILIDPKKVELSNYSNSNHLYLPVIHDTDDAIDALTIALEEMKARYQTLNEKGYRNITEYNQNEPRKMPLLVIVIDELAELMMTRDRKQETEELICRLAQMARAVGIHLIVATQRPSVDVITGLIKANIPSRVAFAVSSGVDSRTIIDTQDAKDLLGAGDMIYVDSMNNKRRIQGAYVDCEQINSVI